ncbi:MAG: M12 family metallopeptidase [Bryobacteraceae bacterium]
MFRFLLSFSLLATAIQAQDALPQLRTVILNGQPLTYEIRDEYAIIEGDIIIGTAADMDAAAKAEADGAKEDAGLRKAVQILTTLGTAPLWPNNTLYYVIDSTITNPQRILAAINHWNTRTPLKVVPRVAEADYVRFVATTGSCASSAGRIGGQQTIVLDEAGCDLGAVIHEIGHTWGFLHEQSRSDRNTWLTLLYENIDTVTYSQFSQFRTSRDVGFYDYGSIMHYPTVAFSVANRIVETTVPPGIPIGQRNGLSAGDVDAISRIYGVVPTKTTITTVPEGLTFFADGQPYTSPRSFDWVPGSVHTLSTNLLQGPLGGVLDAKHYFVRWTDNGSPDHVFVASANTTVVSAQFQQRFRITTDVAAGKGKITVEPPTVDGYYPAGTLLHITATPESGQAFRSWTASPSVLSAYLIGSGAATFDLELSGNLDLRANFTDQPLTTITSVPVGQFVYVDGLAVRTPANFIWAANSSHTLEARTPLYSPSSSTRYRYAGWQDGTSGSLRTVKAGTEDATYTVRFLEQHYLDWARVGSGNLLWSPGQDSNYIDAGITLALSAQPLSGQAIQYWMGDVTGGGTSKTLLMDRPKRVVTVLGTPLPFRLSNAASFLINPAFEQPASTVAPLEMVTLFGTNVGPATLTPGQLDSQGRLASGSGNTRVLFDGIAAPVLNTSSTQTTVIVPKEVASRTSTTVALERNGVITGTQIFAVAPTLPGIFTADSTGSGPIVAINPDGTRNSMDRPAAPGSYVVLFATGAGLMDGNPANGEIMGAAKLVGPLAPVYVRIGREPVQLYYAGSSPTQVNGVVQINAQIPTSLTTGEWPIRVIFGNASSAPGTTIFVK